MKQATPEDWLAALARDRHLEWMRYAWQRTEPLIIGRHTQKVCEIIDNAIERYRNGESSFLVCLIPFRHGKSDLVSRYLPPRFLGLFPDDEVLLATYSSELSADFSRFGRRVITSQQFQRAFPRVRMAQDSAAADRWGIEGHTGGMHAVGLGAALTGRGYSLGIVDDYIKNREEAESQTIRDKRWDSFTNDFFTRRAPRSITIVTATPWHEDDIVGRIKRAMKSDPQFPAFEIIRFPAYSNEYPSGTLFPERFDRAWYDGHRAALGQYGAASLMQCEPITKGGARFRINNIKIIDESPKGLEWVRSWDLASSRKERDGDDPDWTVGAKVAVKRETKQGISVPIYHVYVADVKRIRAEAPERNRLIVKTAEEDGAEVPVVVEGVAGYKDAFVEVRDILKGLRLVHRVTHTGDKVQRASALEPIVDGGNFCIINGEWNRELVVEMARFPGGAHDDQVDAISTAFSFITRRAVMV